MKIQEEEVDMSAAEHKLSLSYKTKRIAKTLRYLLFIKLCSSLFEKNTLINIQCMQYTQYILISTYVYIFRTIYNM